MNDNFFRKTLREEKRSSLKRDLYMGYARSFFFAPNVLSEAIASDKWVFIVHIVISFLSFKKWELQVRLSSAFKSSCAFILLFLLTACSSNMLTVQTDYLSVETLASSYVSTPDPLQLCPPIGQVMRINWNLPKNCSDPRIDLTLRFRNREELRFSLTNLKSSGTYQWPLVNNDYFEKGGILTYKAELISSDCVLAEWIHPLWVDLITFDQN